MMKRVELLHKSEDTHLLYRFNWKEKLTLKLRDLVRAQNPEDRWHMILHLSSRLVGHTYIWHEEFY